LEPILTFTNKRLFLQKVRKVEEWGKSLTDAEKLALLFTISGAWKDERSTETIIQDLQQTRVFNRTIEPL
jgi:hypothetical protein